MKRTLSAAGVRDEQHGAALDNTRRSLDLLISSYEALDKNKMTVLGVTWYSKTVSATDAKRDYSFPYSIRPINQKRVLKRTGDNTQRTAGPSKSSPLLLHEPALVPIVFNIPLLTERNPALLPARCHCGPFMATNTRRVSKMLEAPRASKHQNTRSTSMLLEAPQRYPKPPKARSLQVPEDPLCLVNPKTLETRSSRMLEASNYLRTP